MGIISLSRQYLIGLLLFGLLASGCTTSVSKDAAPPFLLERAKTYYTYLWSGHPLDPLEWHDEKLRDPDLPLNAFGGLPAMQRGIMHAAESRDGFSSAEIIFLQYVGKSARLKVALSFANKTVLVLDKDEYWVEIEGLWKRTLGPAWVKRNGRWRQESSAKMSKRMKAEARERVEEEWQKKWATVLEKSSVIREERLAKSELVRASAPEMVLITGGCFTMGGSYGNNYDSEKPRHKVCLDDFKMDTFEVTNKAFQKFKPGFPGSTISLSSLILASKKDDDPAANIIWEEADQFCKSHGKRLPTEAEWEYAARAGGNTKYSWGSKASEACDYANIEDETYRAADEVTDGLYFMCNDGFAGVSPGGSFKPNAYGLYNMLGNIAEWVNDWYGKDYYKISPKNNPKGPKMGKHKVSRGLSYGGTPRHAHVGRRLSGVIDRRTPLHGFRCAKDAK